MINEILLRRKNKITLPSKYIEEDSTRYVLTMMKNIQSLGYTFSAELINKLKIMDYETIKLFYSDLKIKLQQIVGADKVYEPFYPNFPNQVMEMDDAQWIMNAMIHYWSEGELVPDYQKYEMFPIFIEDDSLTVLDIGTSEDLNEILNNLINSKTSLSEQDKLDLVEIIKENGIDPNNLPEQIPFKENMVIIAKLIVQNVDKSFWFDILSKYIKTATDVLRFATELSGGDTSLKDNTRYKSFSRRRRLLLLQLLENCRNIEEDMKRHRMKWLRLSEILHPSEFPQYEKVNVTIGKLRNPNDFNKLWRYLPKEYESIRGKYNDFKIKTFAGKVDEAIRNGNIEYAVKLLKNRPGELARKLDSLLRNKNAKGQYSTILNAFSDVADQISIPVLLQVNEHFKYRNNDSDVRVFFPKGQLTKGYVKDNNLEEIPKNTCVTICGICEAAIIRNFKNKDPLGKVYISDTMKGFCVPQSQRSASSGMKIITRGSKIPFENDYIRLFIRWENEITNYGESRTDIDLSCTFLDKDYCHVGEVAYYDLKNSYSWHSGDYVDAPRPYGASEFIDIDINKARSFNVKYAVMQIYGYTNHHFADLDGLYAGWMEREDINSGEVYEPSTVKNKINLTGRTYCSLPLVIDLETKEIIWMDLALTTDSYFSRNALNNRKGTTLTVRGIIESHKPQMYELIGLNALARGEIVTDRNIADIIFDTDTTKPTYKVMVEVQNENGEVIEVREEEREKDIKIITPFDTDVFMGDLL